MRRNIPLSLITTGHCDFEILSEIEGEILARAGGLPKLEEAIPPMLRECIDDVIQTPRTGRRSYEELEKTEKTYIGTRVEIMLRALLGLKKGRLDLTIAGYDVDVKHTMGGNWMIPVEALGHPCVLLAADEEHAVCYMGLIVARPEYLTAGANRDAKRSISAGGFQHVRWLLNAVPYPPNFWRTLSSPIVDEIFAGTSGNSRAVALFTHVRDRPITRNVIEAVGRQKDFMRRIRADKGPRGTRGALARAGIVLMSGDYDQQLARAFRLTPPGPSEFMSHLVRDDREAAIARRAGYQVPWPTS